MSVLTKSLSDVKFEIFKILLATQRNKERVGFLISEEINHLIEVSSEVTELFLESCKDERITLEAYLKEYDLLLNQRSLTRKEQEELQNGNE